MLRCCVLPHRSFPFVALLIICGCANDPERAPQIHDYGGAVLAHPEVVPVFFPNDADQPRIEAFVAALSASPYWSQTTAEYGVGPLAIDPSIVSNDAPPPKITSAEIEAWLVAQPFVSPDRVYAVFYPPGTTVADEAGELGCVKFGGFHGEAQGIVYIAMPRCEALGDLRGLDALTAPLSHELVEAATDPFFRTNPAYAAVDADHMVWNLMPLGEVGDLCSYEPRSYDRLVGPFMVQRTWSNASARAGHDPCVPAPATPYFRAVPVLTDAVTLAYDAREIRTLGVNVPVGESQTIDVRLASDAPTSDWNVTAIDAAVLANAPAQLSFSWDAQRGNDGDTLHLTITRLANGPYRGSEIVVSAQQGTTTNLWYGFVGN